MLRPQAMDSHPLLHYRVWVNGANGTAHLSQSCPRGSLILLHWGQSPFYLADSLRILSQRTIQFIQWIFFDNTLRFHNSPTTCMSHLSTVLSKFTQKFVLVFLNNSPSRFVVKLNKLRSTSEYIKRAL